MKKITLILMVTLSLFSCKTQSVTNTKVDNKVERILKGNWTITNVNFPGSDYLSVNSFSIADSKCFVDSKWKFVSNNNSGNMALENATCNSYSSPISWFINKEGNFVLKILNDEKAKKVGHGYILRVENVTETSFDLVDNVNIGGAMKNVVYTFNKTE